MPPAIARYVFGGLAAVMLLLSLVLYIQHLRSAAATAVRDKNAAVAEASSLKAQGNVTTAAAQAADNSLTRTVIVHDRAENAAAVIQKAVGADTAVPQSVQDATLAGVAEQRNEVGK